LAERPPALLRGALLTAAGAVLLLFSTGVLEESAWDFVWPAAVVVAGVLIVVRFQGREIAGAGTDDVVRSTAVFSGAKAATGSQAFRGAWLTAVFGGVTLDLRGARPAPEGATVNATVAFGGADILVPEGWRIAVRSTPIFGGVDDKTRHEPPPADDAPVLHVDAVALFGGVDIKHKR
ncbi:MAG TPA: LiaF domain-containing protein, partial [Baekduia sp.]|nr:LiaF domain-containing protein [Baekduia sp.]